MGHPERITSNFQQCLFTPCNGDCFYSSCEGKHWTLPYFGVMQVTVLPPTDLIHPVYMFTHTYCTPELEVAINMGYTIIQIHEVLHWQETEMYYR